MIPLLTLLFDAALLIAFSRPLFPASPSSKWGWALPPLACYAAYRVFWGFEAMEATGWRDAAVLSAELLLCWLLGVLILGLGKKASLLDALIFILALQVGRKTYFHVFVPLFADRLSNTPWPPFFLCLLKALFVLSLAPKGRPPEEENIRTLHLLPLFFALAVCLIMDVSQVTAASGLDVTLACYVSAFVCTFMVRRALEQERQLVALQRIQENMRLQYALARQQQQDADVVRRMYHDLKHQIAALETGEGRQENLRALKSSLEKVRPFSCSDRPVLDAVFADAARRAEAEGIRFTVESRFGLFPMLGDLELSTLFSNALSNALEACRNSSEKWILCRYHETPHAAAVLLQNTCSGVLRDAQGRLQTAKDARFHGIGLRSMETIVAQAGGALDTEEKNGVFTLTLYLPKGDTPFKR